MAYGLDRARVNRIAERAGANKRLIYHYIGNKEELYARVLLDAYRDIRAGERALHLSDLPPVEAMDRLVGFTFDHFETNPWFIRLLANENIHRGAFVSGIPEVRELTSPIIEQLQGVLAAGVASGAFRPGVGPDQLYVSIIGLSYFFLSNIHTLSVVFGHALDTPDSHAARRAHVISVVRGFLAHQEAGTQITSELLLPCGRRLAVGGYSTDGTATRPRQRERRMTQLMSRRQFGGLLGGAAALSLLASLDVRAAGEAIRLIWWGNPDRDRRTNEVVDLYKCQKGTEVVQETYGWGDYWQKLATQAAGSNLPDVIQMDYRYIFEYARRGQLAALDAFVGKQLTLDDFDPNQLNSGKVDGNLYGVSMGANSHSHIYKKPVFDGLGLTMPDSVTWTNDDFMAMGQQAKAGLPEGVYFTQNMGYLEPRLESFVRQRGKALYTAEGALGYELQDLVDFFGYWKAMQDEGLTPPADVSALDASNKMEESMIVLGKTLFGFIHSNQLVANQKLVPEELAIVMVPGQSGGQPGQYLKPSMLLSMAESSPNKEAAAELMNFFLTDEGANDILQIERGVTGDASVRERLLAGLSDTEKKIVDYLNVVATSISPLPPPPPKNAGEVDRAMRPAWDAIAFGQVTVEEGAKTFYDESAAILARA